ncbi:MAG: MarR family winged helix-turn-helix transcriptional regulator [Planctomycetota bacterium]|nr:MarR family winged helix-turn-helix transcriptional regulator [Planctomycetota bacterium]
MIPAPAKTEPDVADLIASECLGYRIRLLSRTLSGIYDTALRPLGLTAGQLNILVAIAKLGPVSSSEVSKRLSMEKSTVSRNLDRMKSHGWIKATPGATGNTHLLSVSPVGHRLLGKALPLWKEAQFEAKTLLGQRGAKSIQQAADSISARRSRT